MLNSRFAQGLLRFFMSKLGVAITAGAAWIASHIVLWLGLAAFVDHDSLLKIQQGMQGGIDAFGEALLAGVYAWVFHRNTAGVKILKAQLDQSKPRTPDMAMNSGAIGNNTLLAAEAVTGVSIEKAAAFAGVDLPS